MRETIITIRGFLKNIDKYNTATLVFLDDYNLNNTDKLSFTKTFLTRQYDGATPLIDDNTFKIKCKKIHIGFVADHDSYTIVDIRKLVQHQVECVVKVKPYNFYKKNTQYKGWSLILQEMKLLQL